MEQETKKHTDADKQMLNNLYGTAATAKIKKPMRNRVGMILLVIVAVLGFVLAGLSVLAIGNTINDLDKANAKIAQLEKTEKSTASAVANGFASVGQSIGDDAQWSKQQVDSLQAQINDLKK